MWFSPHENHAREAHVLFYLVATTSPPMPQTSIWGSPGEAFFVKKRVGAQRRVTVAPGGVRSRPKSPRDAQGRQSGAQKLTFRRPGAPFLAKIRDSGPLREHWYLLCFHHIYTPGADLFRTSNWRGVALGSRTVFFPLFVAPGAQK
mgnify:CR=1 FL=1